MLVTFAVPHESRPFRRLAAGKTVTILHTGIGEKAAVATIRERIQRQRPEIVISSGFAGGLSRDLKVGDLVSDPILSSPDLLSALPPGVTLGDIHTSAEPIASAGEKAALAQTSGSSIAVDMESSAIASVCREAAVPLLILRVISDGLTDPLPVPLAIAWDLRRQRPRPLRLALWLAAHPSQIRPFAIFLRDTNRAAEQLAVGLSEVVAAINRRAN